MNTPNEPYVEFNKIARLSRDIGITEKIDGTNALVYITEAGEIFAGSRTRWITPEQDNYGFARWVEGNKDELMKLGPGKHFGEWWGQGIQRKYDMKEKRFSLFNTFRWGSQWREERQGRLYAPECCYVVPTLYSGVFSENAIQSALDRLVANGSVASPGFMNPEGIVIWHTAANLYFKKTIENDEMPKGLVENKK